MKVQGIEIKGRSVSGYETAIALPEYDLCFDIGIATHHAVQCSRVAITHAHLDHLADAAKHAYRRGMTGMSTPEYIVGSWMADSVREQFAYWGRVQQARTTPHKVTVAREDEDIMLDPKGKRFLRAFPTVHRVRSQGYTLFESRKRLKPEFVGTPGRELGRMRREGIAFEDEFEVPLFTLTGDTQAKVLDRMPQSSLEAKVVAIECTFLGDVSHREAIKKGHVHIDLLAQRADKFEAAEAIVLYHFSKRYRNKDIEAAIAELPASMRAKTTYIPVGKYEGL